MTTPNTTPPAAATPTGARVGRYRWRIVAVLFLATTVNYVDRNVLSFTMLDETFRRTMLGIDEVRALTPDELGVFKTQMGYVDAAFKAAYALGFLLMGWVIDKLGTRYGYSLAIGFWSLAGIAHAFVRGIGGLAGARFALGVGEAGNFPSAIKSVAEWFPRKERSFATGVFNAGANVGIIFTAAAIPFIILSYGWQASFWLTGALGLVVLFFWWGVYQKPERHPCLSAAELAHIQAEGPPPPAERFAWGKLLGYRATWAFGLGKFFTDAVWWFYLTWLPDFFNSSGNLTTKLDLKTVGLPFIVIYVVSDAGSIFFGWLATRLMARGWSANRARKTTMLICGLCVVPIFLVAFTSSIGWAIALIALATAAHQGWSANLFTTVSDQFPQSAVGSVVGIGGMMGAVGGVLLAAASGAIISSLGYTPLFVWAACAYLVALLVIQALSPRLAPVRLT